MQTFSILEVHFYGIFGNVTSFKSIGHCNKKTVKPIPVVSLSLKRDREMKILEIQTQSDWVDGQLIPQIPLNILKLPTQLLVLKKT